MSFLLKILLLLILCLSKITANSFHTKNTPILTTENAIKHCDCYLVSGSDPGYFQHYQLWDFRNAPLPREFKSPGTGTTDDDDHDGDGNSDGDNDDGHKERRWDDEERVLPLSRSPFAKDWMTQIWDRRPVTEKPVPILNSAGNVFFARDPPGVMEKRTGKGIVNGNDTYLVLRTTQLPDHNSAAELESRMTNIYHCSLRIRFRVLPYNGFADNESPTAAKAADGGGGSPPAGACAGIFTYNPTTGSESDIEILTKDPTNIIHYANQPDYDPVTDTSIPGASTIAAIPTPWTEWATHRLDWLRNVSVWYLNDHVQTTSTYRVPEMPSTLVLNLWSDGGEWSGGLAVGQSVFLGIEWVQLVYNVSDTSDLRGGSKDKNKRKNHYTECRSPCWVD